MKALTISTNELRFSFSKVLEALAQKRALLLTYRNKPLARIEPLTEAPTAPEQDDPFFSLPSLAEALGSFTSTAIDEEVYGQ